MLFECFFVTSDLLPYMRWMYVIEHRYNDLSLLFSALQYFHQFFQAPLRGSIVLREDNHRYRRILDCLKERRRDLVALVELVIDEGFDLLSGQSFVKMASEVGACVLTSKADEHIILSRSQWTNQTGRRRRRSSCSGKLQLLLNLQLVTLQPLQLECACHGKKHEGFFFFL